VTEPRAGGGATALVGIVIVSHSAGLAAGVCELVAQLAPGVAIRPAGGTADGDLGTSFDKILAAVTQADGGAGVVILYDLGSAKLTAVLVAEVADAARVVDAPLVEGAIAAAVTAQSGATLDVVANDAAAAGCAASPSPATRAAGAAITRSYTLRNPHGLHARPAAQLARIAAEHGVALQLGGITGALVEARSILAVVALGLRGGAAVRVELTGSRAGEAALALEAAIDDGFGERAMAAPPSAPAAPAIGASPGIAIGPIHKIRLADPDLPEVTGDPATERAVFDAALAQAARELDLDRSELAGAHRALLADPQLVDRTHAAIAMGIAAAPAWWRAVRVARERLSSSPDEVIAQRAIDVTDVGLRVLSRIAPEHARTELAGAASAIVLADDLAPSIIEQLAAAGVAGIALACSGASSHAAIIARGRGVPMVVRAGPHDVADGTLAILDGDRGSLILAPDDRALADARTRRAAAQLAHAAALADAHAPVTWRGRAITIAANVASIAEAVLARDNGADAIGLVRTELLFVDRPDLPSEDEQVEQLAGILRVFSGREVTIRTLDVGGDKHIPALALDPITHGFLGLRGLRYSLAHPDTLRVQLRAILRAAAGWTGTLSVMAPMVTTVDEVLAFRAAISAATVDLGRAAARRPDRIGIMIETPAAAIAFDTLSAHVDFASVGSNDLVQYMMAAERTNPAVANLYQPDHPAIWRTIEALARSLAGKKLAICGEMAAHPDHARRLVELGADELSMAPSSVPSIKSVLRSTSSAFGTRSST
jgi:phosphocarrier protein FPr